MNGVSPGGRESLAAEPGVDNGTQIVRTKKEKETQIGRPGQKTKDTREEKQLQSRQDSSLELLVALSPRDGWQQQEGGGVESSAYTSMWIVRPSCAWTLADSQECRL